MGKRRREMSMEKLHRELKRMTKIIRRNQRRHSGEHVKQRRNIRARSPSWASGSSCSSHSRPRTVSPLSSQDHSIGDHDMPPEYDVSPQVPEENQDDTHTITEIPDEIKKILGEEGIIPEKESNDLHDSLKKRWDAILQDGMVAETRVSLIKKYDTPSNCQLLVPPKLNEEVAATMNESGLKRDKRIQDKQKTLAAAISALGCVLNDMLIQNRIKEIETLNDAARLLCDIYHSDTTTRRALILPGLNKDVKDVLENSTITEYLFGDKLQDKVSACKAVKKSASELKNTPSKPKLPMKPKYNTNLNSRGPQRPIMPRPSGPKQKQRHQTYRPAPKSHRYKRSPERHHQHRRQTRR